MRVYCIIIILFWTYSCQDIDNVQNKNISKSGNSDKKIIIEVCLSPAYLNKMLAKYKDEGMPIQYNTLNYVESVAPLQVIKVKISKDKIKSAIHTNVPVLLSFPSAATVIAKPGDSINVNYGEENIVYSGKEPDEYELLNEIMKIQKKFVRPTENSFTIHSLEDFLRWNQYSDDKLSMLLPVVDSFRDRIPPFNYEYYKADIINWVEFDRVYSFKALRNYIKTTPLSGLSTSDLNAIWDSTQYKLPAKWFRSLSTFYGAISGVYAFNSMEVGRKFNFDAMNDSLISKSSRTLLYYNAAKQNYKGLVRERLMSYILDEQAMLEMGLKNPTTQAMLKDYYNQPGFPEYKQWIKELQGKAEKKYARN